MKSEQPAFTATLKDGLRYTLLSSNPENKRDITAVVFEKGQPVSVSVDTKAHLEANAVQIVETNFGAGHVEIQQKCKFEFEPIATEDRCVTTDRA